MRIQRGDRQRRDARAAHDDARGARGVAAVEQGVDRAAVGQRFERAVLAVDRLGPRLHRAPRGDLQDVGREAAVGQREVQRGGAGVGVELRGRDLCDRDAGGQRVGHGGLDQGRVGDAAVAPRHGDQLGLEVVHALGLGLDRQQPPALAGRVQRPPLGQRRLRAARAVLEDGGAVLVDDVVVERRVDPDDDAVLLLALAVDQPHVLDARMRLGLAAVLPALAPEVLQPPAPLDHQVCLRRVAPAPRCRWPTSGAGCRGRARPPRSGPSRGRSRRRRWRPRRPPARSRAPGRRGACGSGRPATRWSGPRSARPRRSAGS